MKYERVAAALILGVSLVVSSWLLSGRGEAPVSEASVPTATVGRYQMQAPGNGVAVLDTHTGRFCAYSAGTTTCKDFNAGSKGAVRTPHRVELCCDPLAA